jgi:hypothetical protein
MSIRYVLRSSQDTHLNTHGLGGDELDNASITGLDELGRLLKSLARTTIDLFDQLGELAGNVGSVTIKNGGVASTNLTGVVQNDDLSVEGSGLLGGVVLGVRGNVTTADILDGDVPAIESGQYSIMDV